MKEITELCANFSSLIVTYNDELGSLFVSEMHPTLEALDLHVVDDMDETDSPKIGLLFSLYDKLVTSCPS